MSYLYYKKVEKNKVVQLAIYEKSPEQFRFISGFSVENSAYELDKLVEISCLEYAELVNVLNIGHRYETTEPKER